MKIKWKKILVWIMALIITAAAGFLVYASDYYRADAVAAGLLKDPSVTVETDRVVVSPEGDTDTALIFYPGAKVEYTAYLPLLKEITEESGITAILVKMPFNLAIFDADAAEGIMAEYPGIRHWYAGGHSMGGAMASDFASKHPEKVQGLILMGAYLYGSYPEDRTLTVYGSLNTSVAEKVDYTENVIIIAGGNHAQFGNYGPQRGDAAASISAEEQQSITVDAVAEFLKEKTEP